MKSQRQLQIAENIKRIMSEIFLREDYSVIMNNVITVLMADVSPDAKNVKIFIDICGDSSKHSQILEKINSNTHNFRYLLAQKIDLRFVPEIVFLQDKNINNSLIIENLINEEKQKSVKKSSKKPKKIKQMLFKTIAIFGSTGSIGKSTLNVIRNDREKFSIKILIAKNDVKTLIEQANEFQPEYVVIENENLLTELQFGLKHLKNCKVFAGIQAILDVAKIQCDLVVSAIVGSAGVRPTLNAISAKSNIALANKESLVCAGEIIMHQAKINNVKIIPVDSEHNAIFQIFEQDNLTLIDDITLTASGGPFFNSNRNFKDITVAEALKHPNWNMGAKISIDSATMMNKGLEMIEAYYLFPIDKEQIKILVHPQSIIHGIVNYADGASLAMLSLPDMQVPISYALNYPQRMAIEIPKMDLTKIQKLEFYEPNEEKFEAIKICRQALEVGGNALVILNASNEIAVEKFLRNEISFDQITKIVSKTLEKIPAKKLDSIDEVMLNDYNAREIAKNIKF